MKTKYPRSFIEEIPILALNWKQPYLNLMLLGKIETRSWPTKYRGLVLMCASQKAYNDTDVLYISGDNNYGEVNRLVQRNRLGQGLAVGLLIDCRPMTIDDEAATFVKYREPWEHTTKSGQVVIKRLWCHVYEAVTSITPVDFSTGQGWSFVSPNILSQIEHDLR